MKKEFTRFFTRKYVWVIVPLLLLILLPCISQFFTSETVNDSEDSVYSNFIDGLGVYDTQEELKKLYDSISGFTFDNFQGIVTTESVENYCRRTLYWYAYQNNLPYDSYVDINNFKYTQFHYYKYYCVYMCIFILLASIIIGSFYQSSDFLNKTAKLVYTSGEKRTKIIAKKYFVSLISLASIVLLFDLIFAFWSMRYSFTGAKYLAIFSDKSVYLFTFPQYVCLNIVSHLLMLTVIYTFVYYLAALLKNGIITSCVFLTIALLLLFFNQYGMPSAQAIFLSMFTQGIAAALTFGYGDTLAYIALYTPFIVVSIATAVTSNILIRKNDYSR